MSRLPAVLLHGPVRGWYPATAATAAWAVHLVATASLVEVACSRDLVWALHVLTGVTASAAVAALAASAWLLRAGGQLRFVGQVSLLVGGINLALILLEGSYVLFLDPCA